ncbi:MAG: hypothetical protein M1837_003129 [Sclerophora amabilis]|nr:MAG: hypothetical protein M1837_003129 [Sclerophora amabilis]
MPPSYRQKSPLDFVYCPTVSQEQFEMNNACRSIEFVCCPTETKGEVLLMKAQAPVQEELVTIRARSVEGYTGFVEQRSLLCRSPTFAAFFSSHHHYPGCRPHIWLVDEPACVFELALRYLLFTDKYVPPTMDGYTMPEQLFLQIRLYFLAKRLQLPPLEEIAFAMLQLREAHIGPQDVVNLARVIYKYPSEKDSRARDFLRRQVEKNLRVLLHTSEWLSLLRQARSSLAADMFELVSASLVNGDAVGNPAKLLSGINKPPKVHENPELCDQVMCPIGPTKDDGNQVSQVETIRNCIPAGNEVPVSNDRHDHGYTTRDYVDLMAGEIARDDTNRASVDGIFMYEVECRRSPSKGKAAWFLGTNDLPDVFFDSPSSKTYGKPRATKGHFRSLFTKSPTKMSFHFTLPSMS